MITLSKYVSFIVFTLNAALANAFVYPDDPTAPHPDIYVATNGNDSTGDGTQAKP